MIRLTPTQQQIFRAVRAAAPDALDTAVLLERLPWLKNRENLKAQAWLMRRAGIPIRGGRGRYGGYRLARPY